MVTFRGMPPQSNGGYGSSDFYHASRDTSYPTGDGTAGASIPGQSRYDSMAQQQAADPYGNVGRVNVSLLQGAPGGPQGGPNAPQLPQMPNAETILRSLDLPWAAKGTGMDFPGIGVVGSGIDFLSNIAGAMPSIATPKALEVYKRVRDTPDDQLQPWEQQIKELNQGLFATMPDSPIMEGKQVAEVYNAYQIAEAHAHGSSAMLNTDPGQQGLLDMTPGVGPLLQLYGDASNLLKRALGSGPQGDQLQQLKRPDATEAMIGPERWDIKQKLDSGQINDEEARDMIAKSSFALSNPNPIHTGTPLDVVMNAGLALAGEIVTDPLTYVMAVPTLGGSVAAAPVEITLKSIMNSVGRAAVESATKSAGGDIAEATALEITKTATEAAAKEATEQAAGTIGRTASMRSLPKAATAAAKATGRVGTEHVEPLDQLEALLTMGADRSHPLSGAIRQGIEDAGMAGHIAVKAPRIIRTAEAINKMTDPFALFGYWRTGKTVSMALSKSAAHGAYDAMGWRTVRAVDDAYRDAGIGEDVVNESRDLAITNHVVQAGDRSNTQRMVASNSIFRSGETPAEAAISHMEKRPGDIRRLVRDQVDRTMDFIMPRTKGGRSEALKEWRARAAQQLTNMGASPDRAASVAARMDERQMRVLANDHWGFVINALDQAKHAAVETADWPKAMLDRVTFMGPTQLAQQDSKQLLKDIADGNVAAVRDAVHRFKDLNLHISEGLSDQEIMDRTAKVLKEIDKALPVRIEDMTGAPPEIEDFARKFSDYPLMLRPKDEDMLIGVRDPVTDRVTGAHTWLDHVTNRTPSVEIGRLRAIREDTLRGISGGEIERNVGRRFAQTMGEKAGWTQAEASRVMRSIHDVGRIAETVPMGLSAEQIYGAVEAAHLPQTTIKNATKRMITDSMVEAYENELRLVGVMPKLTGWAKTSLTHIASPIGDTTRVVSDFLYPLVRFRRNPLFFGQETPEGPFFLALMGRYPISSAIPDRLATALELVPGVRRYAGISQKLRRNLWDERTLAVMDRMSRMSPNAENDMYDSLERIRMGLTQASDMTRPDTSMGRMLGLIQRGEWRSLPERKARSVALAAREELGELWRRSLQENAPEQWLAVRGFYPKDMSDGEVAVQWAMDMMARADPDSIYGRLGPSAFNPMHIGRRAEVSDLLIRHFVYGDDAEKHSWSDLVGEIKDGTVSEDQVRNDLKAAGADPDYIERAMTKLTFGSEDEFYQAAVDLGVDQDTADAWKASNRLAAERMGIPPEEYLSRQFAGRPLETNQMGNIVGDTLFDDIVENMRVRGKSIPDADHPDTAALMKQSHEMITDVLPAGGKPILKGQPVPGLKLKVVDDPPVYLYEDATPWGDPALRQSDQGIKNAIGVTVHDPKTGKMVGSVEGTVDENGLFHTAMVQVHDDYQNRGIANWMYRQLEEKRGVTIAPSTDQTEAGRGLWAQVNRPFGPAKRTVRQTKDAFEAGSLLPVGPVRHVDPLTLKQTGRLLEEERYLDRTDAPGGVIREPVAVDAEGRVIDGNDRVALAKEMGIKVPTQTYVFPARQTPDQAKTAAAKVRSWMKARSDREQNPFIGAPPIRGQEAAVEPARFGVDARGNATVPEAFKSKPGYVYRTVAQARMGSDWRVGEYAARHPATIYADSEDSVVLRVKQDVTGWKDAVGGVGAHENVQSEASIPASAVEVLGADGKWRPVQAPTSFPTPLYQTDFHTIGVTTPEAYRRQLVTMMDPDAMAKRGMRAMTEKDARLAIDWYDHIRRAQFALVDESIPPAQRVQEAARHLIAFGTTQLNTSPADGFRHVFKAYGMKARGEVLQSGEARNILQQAVGLNPEQLQALVWGDGNKIDQMGIAQKLFDFIDSLTGAKTRTNGILGPNGDWGPVAVDVHTKRDFGFLDDKMGDWVYRLVEKEGPNGELIRGVKSSYTKGKGFTVEMSDGSTEHIGEEHITNSVPSDHQYDYGVELANDIRDHFNDTNFMNRQWSSYEVQAIGWYRMQLLKSSEGDAGSVANAMYEQSRWMGSNDLVPSANAPMHEVQPWDAVEPQYHQAIHVAGAYAASDEAEQMSGVNVLSKMDAHSVVGGTYRPAQTVEVLTDPTGIEQYLAHYLLLSEQNSGVMMRDYVGAGAKKGAPRYGSMSNGVQRGRGISVDIPVRDEAHANDLIHLLAAEDGSPLRSIGPHTYVARASDGSLHLRTLWMPADIGDRNAFKKALTASGLEERLKEIDPTIEFDPRGTMVDFVHMQHDWAADPTGKTFMDVIQRGSGEHGVMRSAEQRQALVATYDGRHVAAQEAAAKARRMRASNPAKPGEIKKADAALAAAKKEMEVARAAPGGRPADQVSQLVGSARVRVRDTVNAAFDKYASREVRNERERVIGEARDAAAARLGTDPSWNTVLDTARASNGERLYERTPGGRVRAAISRAATGDRRSQLYFGRANTSERSLLHELSHKDAWEYDDSANRIIAGQHAGLEGTPYGTWTPGTPLTEAQHEWLVSQRFLWAQHPDTVHPTLQPLLAHLNGKLGSDRTLAGEARAPSREAMKRIDADILALESSKAGKSARAVAAIDQRIITLRGQRQAAAHAATALSAQGGLSPAVKDIFDEEARKAAKRTEVRASTYSQDEAQMMEWFQISMAAAQKRANDLVHMRGERSMLERSINHPILALYPTAYMYGKVLPYMAEFLMAKPFGIHAPFEALTLGNQMNQSFERQQQYDPKLRDFLYKNEPFLRAASMFVPGLPWDMPSGLPYWQRDWMDNWADNNVRRLNGQPEVPLDIPSMIGKSLMTTLTPRGPDAWAPTLNAIGQAPDILSTMLTGRTPDERAQDQQLLQAPQAQQ